jgi:hypothetical protein
MAPQSDVATEPLAVLHPVSMGRKYRPHGAGQSE